MSLDNNCLPSINKGVYAFVVKRWSFIGIRVEEEIHARAIRIDENSIFTSLDSDTSWELVNAARVEGEDWLSAPNEVNTENVSKVFDDCDMKLTEDYSITKEDHINENSDRVTFQIRTAQKHRDRLLITQRTLLEKYKIQSNKRLIPMTEGKIQKIENKFNVQVEKLKQKAKMTSSSSDVAYGVIKIM